MRVAYFIFLLLFTFSFRKDAFCVDNISQLDSSKIALQNSVSDIDQYYTSLYQSGKFNGNILIAYKGEPIYKKSLGYAVKATGERLNQVSSFQLASTSKPFTAAAILILYERGKLDIDDLVTTFYPNFPYKGVTIRHLLSHRSGLPDYLNYGASFGKKTYISNQDVMNMFAQKRPGRLAAPNTVFKYNNSNYAVLAALVENISGESFSDFCKENIFDPLKMKNTWVWHPSQERKEGQTYGYNAFWKPRSSDMFDGVAGDKGVYSTTEDLLKWDLSWSNNTLLKSSTIQAAYEGQTKGHSGKDYGLGWRTTDLQEGKKIIYHNGWWHDYNIVFKRFIDDSLTIIIMSNKYNQSIYNTGFVENTILKDGEFKDYNILSPQYALNEEENRIDFNIHYHPFSYPPSEKNSDVNTGKTPPTINSHSTANSGSKYYVVKKGDTLFNISQRFNITVEALKKWNRMASANIQLGQKLLIDRIKGND
ncbi:MAG: serine hydrolase [Chitinophagales bacterium]|nr:serine hydrolase [Chitinophagales bacterium]MCZ2393875.1 serine hydrolase [Chitinophagales bacterium]